MNIPRHPKICHFTLLSFTNKNISGRQVTMDYLKEFEVTCVIYIWINYLIPNLHDYEFQVTEIKYKQPQA